MAAVEHDTWLLHQPDLVDVTIGSVALTLESQRLAANARAAAQDVQASSMRLARASDDARAVVETAIEYGPVRTLDAVVAHFDEDPVPLQERVPMLEVRDLTGANLHDIALTVHKGEVLGVGGLAGQGQRDLLQTLFGIQAAHGGTILLHDRFEPESFLASAARHRAAFSFMVPTMVNMLIAHPRLHQHDLSALRQISYGGAPMAPARTCVSGLSRWR